MPEPQDDRPRRPRPSGGSRPDGQRGPRGRDERPRRGGEPREGSGRGRPEDRRGDDGRQSGRPGRPVGGVRGASGREMSSDRSGLGDRPPRKPRVPEPPLPEDVTGAELDRSVHQQLRTLTKENAEGVARHLVMVAATLAADELELALAHAQTAVRRAGRVAAAREALGMVTYRLGDFGQALGEFRTVRRLSGSHHLLPLMVDCERGLGRHDRALELATSPDARAPEVDQAELAIVVSGIRRDLGQVDAALLALQVPALKRAGSYRLQYAYADVLSELGRTEEARAWFAKAALADVDGETDAVERLEEIDGTVVTDLGDGDEGAGPVGQAEAEGQDGSSGSAAPGAR